MLSSVYLKVDLMDIQVIINFSVHLALSSKKDSDLQPVKGGTVHDLDDDGDKNEDSQPGKASDTQVGHHSIN